MRIQYYANDWQFIWEEGATAFHRVSCHAQLLHGKYLPYTPIQKHYKCPLIKTLEVGNTSVQDNIP